MIFRDYLHQQTRLRIEYRTQELKCHEQTVEFELQILTHDT